MFAKLATLFLLASSAVLAAPLRYEPKELDTRDYKEDANLLEDYDTYSTRYEALDCSNEHGSPFFESEFLVAIVSAYWRAFVLIRLRIQIKSDQRYYHATLST